MPLNTKRPAGGDLPRGPLPAHAARAAPGTHAHKKSALREGDALPSRSLALQYSAKAGLTAGFDGTGDPCLCGRARGALLPAAQGY